MVRQIQNLTTRIARTVVAVLVVAALLPLLLIATPACISATNELKVKYTPIDRSRQAGRGRQGKPSSMEGGGGSAEGSLVSVCTVW